MNRKFFILSIMLSFCAFNSNAQTNCLKNKIEQIIKTKDATVGVSIRGIENDDSLSINGDTHFPMQSVFKFHIALAVLDQVDKENLSLEQEILISKDELLPDTWSPIRDKYPDGNIKLTLAEILKYTVAISDNNGCDILLKIIGGPEKVEKYIHKIGIQDIAISFNEEEMHKDWNAQFSNWTTPKAATDLLIAFYTKNILSKSSFDFLLKTMTGTSTGKNKIRGQLPLETIVAHKTGSSGKNTEGITAADNDIGIVTLPDGKHFAISVFVTNSKENDETNEKIISDISKLTWDYFIARLNLSESNTLRTGDNSMTSLDWDGTYEGILPCADCEGIKTVIKLNKDQTYSLQLNYLGKDNKTFESIGTFCWDQSGNKIILDNIDTKFYWVGENKITQLDNKGNRVTGKLADTYVLLKVDNQITEKYWKLVELMSKKVQHNEKNKREPHIILKTENNRVHGSGGCNTFNGSYELKEGNRISFSKIASTLMACDNMETEAQFLKVLEMTDNYFISVDTLILNKARMAPLAKFEAVYLR
jgi:beta-lactamase class A/heat shock protein HslJ